MIAGLYSDVENYASLNKDDELICQCKESLNLKPK